MSGICGTFGKGDIEEMTRILSHRGPDDLGFYMEGPLQLGAQRLAIMDMAGGHQPMSNRSQTMWAVLDGDVFNYEEIRAELSPQGHAFKSATDTEVVIHAWEKWGPNCLRKMNGQFALALWDGATLFLARDRFGEKPLYYYQRGSRLLFASEIKSLLTQLTAAPRFTDEFRDFEAPLFGDTLFQNIRELPAGHMLSFDGKGCDLTRWYDVPVYEGPYSSAKDYADELRWLLEDSVRLRLKGDVEAGVLLSGGLDSAVLACLAKLEHVFTVTFKESGEQFDEFDHAKLVARKTKSRHHVIRPKAKDLQDLMAPMVWHLDYPVGSTSSLAAFMAAKKASAHVKALLTGQGADEILGGHVRYLMMLAEDGLGQVEAFRNYLPLARYFWSPEMFSEPSDRFYTILCRGPGRDQRVRARMKDLFSRHNHLIDKMGYTDLHVSLPTVLHLDDRATAAFGLENRNPFLDHRLVEFAFRLPPEMKVDGYLSKAILRQAMRGVVPAEILNREDKMGLAVPVGKWFRKNLKRYSEVRIRRFRERYDANFLNGAWDAAGDRGEFDRKEYMRVCLEVWMETMIDEGSADRDKSALSLS